MVMTRGSLTLMLLPALLFATSCKGADDTADTFSTFSGGDTGDTGDTGDPEDGEFAEPRIRILLGRQYVNAVNDLLGPAAATAASPRADVTLNGFDAIGAAQISLTDADNIVREQTYHHDMPLVSQVSLMAIWLALGAGSGPWRLMGVVVGLLPGCGPQIVTTTLYISGAIPLSAQIGNAISNDGDALFPAIALAPRAAIVATLYTTIPALVRKNSENRDSSRRLPPTWKVAMARNRVIAPIVMAESAMLKEGQ